MHDPNDPTPATPAPTASPTPTPAPDAPSGLSAEVDALLPGARRVAAALARMIGFPRPLTADDFQGVTRDESIPVDAHDTGTVGHLRAHHAEGGLEIGLEASTAWWNPREVANAHLSIFALDRRSKASIRLTLAPPWAEVLLLADAPPAWTEAARALAREHFPDLR